MSSRAIPLRRLLLREGLFIVALAGLGLSCGAWWGTRRIMEDQAQSQAEGGLSQVCRRLESTFDEAIRTGRSLARLWEEQESAGAFGALGTLAAEREVLIHLQARAALCNITLVEPVMGRASAANVPDGTAPGVWFTRGGALLRQWSPEGALLSETPDPEAPPDWRERPWYRQAVSKGQGSWTPPYPFLGSVGYGLTYTLPAKRKDGTLLGIVGVDLLLGDLGSWLRESQPTPGTQVAVLDEGGRLLVPLAQTAGIPMERARAALPHPLSAQDDPLVLAISQALSHASPSSWVRVRSGGRDYLARRNALHPAQGPAWQILMAIPEEDLLHHPRQVAAAAVALSLGALLLLAWRIQLAARKLEGPLSRLASQSSRLMNGEPLNPPVTDIAELQELAHCLRVASLSFAEREALEAQLRQAQRLELVGTLAAGVAHDLGNLLSAISANLDLAKDPHLAEDKRGKALDRAELAMRRAKGFIRALLTLGRPAEQTLISLDLNHPVRNALPLLEPLLGPAITLEAALTSEHLRVMADSLEIEQVVLNLGVNARDAMPGGGRLAIRTGRDQEGRPYLQMEDTGKGIPEAMRARLFTPFATTKEPERGSGLGLAMVQGIAKAHGAMVEVESEEGRGTRFTFRFPHTT